jgi:hypothetical protein
VGTEKQDGPYQPESLWAAVGYTKAGLTSLNPVTASLIQHITVYVSIQSSGTWWLIAVASAGVQQTCEIPVDFEFNHTFGPLSGVTHEERLIVAYSMRKLTLRAGCEYAVLCTSCAEQGHSSSRCPSLFA